MAVVGVVLFLYLLAVMIVGAVSQTSAKSSGVTATNDNDNCFSCRVMQAWWGSLDWWQKLLYGWLWYAIQMVGCAIKGCNK